METNNLSYFKEKLESEKRSIEEELGTISRKNPDVPGDWEPVENPSIVNEADPNERADNQAKFADNTRMTDMLELRLAEVEKALTKIEEGTYGICEVSGEEIEHDKLEANPAARTCKKHVDEKLDA